MEQGFESMDWSDLNNDKSSTPETPDVPEMTVKQAFMMDIDGSLERGDMITFTRAFEEALERLEAYDDWEKDVAEAYKKAVGAMGKEFVYSILLRHYGVTDDEDTIGMSNARPKVDALIARLTEGSN